MSSLYPLRFAPLWRHYLWGGRRLGDVLGKAIPPDAPCAESWEIVDRGLDQSRVLYGPLAGTTLGELVRGRSEALLGIHRRFSEFPLLLKFLDAAHPLSLQVHPNDAQAECLEPPDLGKTEAWVVLAAEPGSYLYAGLRPGVDRAALERALRQGYCLECVHRIEPRAGDCFFLPAGVVHALGPGLLVAEIQQSSDTTYRLFDWNRVGLDGKPRALHIERGLEVIDFAAGPVAAMTPLPGEAPHIERLVACDKFVLNRWRIDRAQTLGGDGRAHLLVVLSGSAVLSGDPSGAPLDAGHAALIPARAGSLGSEPTTVTPHGEATLLDIYLP